MEFEVKPKKLKNIASEEREIQRALNKLNIELSNCQRTLQGCISSAASYNIKRSIDTVEEKLNNSAIKMGIMAEKLDVIATMYTRTENNILGKRSEAETIQFKDAGKISNAKDRAEAIDSIKKLASLGMNPLKSDELDMLTSYLGVWSSLLSLKSSDDLKDFKKEYLKFSSSVLDSSSKTVKEIDKLLRNYGPESLKKWMNSQEDALGADSLGQAGHMVSLFSEIYSSAMESSNVGEFFINISDDANSIRDVVGDFAKLSEEQVKEVGTLYATLGSIALYAIGDGMSEQSSENVWQNVSELWLGSAVSGLNTLTTGYLGDLVQMNVNTFIDNVNKNVDITTDWINSHDIPMGWKIAESVVLSPVVAMWSVGESYFDYGWSIGEKINKLF